MSSSVVKRVQMCGGVVKYVQKEWRYGNLHPDAI